MTRLRFRVPLLLIAFFAVATVATGILKFYEAHRAIRAHTEQTAVFLMTRIQDAIADPLLQNNLTLANHLTAGFALFDAVREIAVVDENGKILLSNLSTLQGGTTAALDGFEKDTQPRRDSIVMVEKPGQAGTMRGYGAVYLAQAPGNMRPTRVGTLFAVFDFRLLYAESDWHLAGELILLSVTLVAAAGLLHLGLSMLITWPVERLVKVVKSFAEGDLDARIALGRSGEIGYLASAFNEMADSLAKDRAERLAREAGERQREKMVALGNLAGGIGFFDASSGWEEVG